MIQLRNPIPKTYHDELKTGDDCIVCVGNWFCVGRVVSDSPATITARYTLNGKLRQTVFNVASGYERGNRDRYWEVPRLYAHEEIVRDKRYTAAQALAQQNQTTGEAVAG